jgi:hypothetical protein
MIDENGTVLKQSGGISAAHVTNGGLTAKTRVTFPADVTNCFWSATNADSANILGANEVVLPRFVSVGRSAQGPNVLEIATLGDGNGTRRWSSTPSASRSSADPAPSYDERPAAPRPSGPLPVDTRPERPSSRAIEVH